VISVKKIILASLFSSTLLLAACEGNDETVEETPTDDTATEQVSEEEETTEEDTSESEEGTEETAAGATIKTGYAAPHGDQAFASVFVVMEGDTIADVILDEYQYMDSGEVTGVPNSEAAFGEGSVEEVTLISKLQNDDLYSEMMAGAGSTVSYADNLAAIQDFAIGQTVSELEESITELDNLGEDGEIADVVSGATLVDTGGYLQAIVDIANNGIEFAGVEEADLANAELSYSLQAPHGDQAFAAVSVLHDGETVLAASIDEFQYLDPQEFEGVPNSDAAFGENYGEDVVLGSKLENDAAYSAMMESAGSTVTYGDNMQAIIDHAEGSTVEEIQATIDELNGLGEEDEIADVVSGATFVDTAGYLQAIVDTINN
jgi:hypothetical protein